MLCKALSVRTGVHNYLKGFVVTGFRWSEEKKECGLFMSQSELTFYIYRQSI